MAQKLLMGNEAFAHAALKAGARVVAGYPGTPSSELVETVAKLRQDGEAEGVHVEWSTNEKTALEVVAGAAYCGARVLFTCKQVGLNVASDALMSLNYVGVEGGTVLFVADDPGPISSQTEQDTRRFAAFAKVPVLDPANPEQGYAMMQDAFALSERYRTPVIVRPTTRICHASTYFDIDADEGIGPVDGSGFRKDPKWVIFPKRSFEAHGEINERLGLMAEEFSDGELARFNPVTQGGSNGAPRVGIIACGVSYAYAAEALDMLQRRAAQEGAPMPAYRLMQVGTPYPFPSKAAARFAEGLDAVLALEELDHVVEDEMLRLAGALRLPLHICGKLTGEARDRGENSVEDALSRIAAFFDRRGGENPSTSADEGEGAFASIASSLIGPDALTAYPDALPARPPVLCAGCPHRMSFYAVKRALRKREAVLCGDIGCYTLGNALPLDAVDTCLCMGAGITMAQGFSIIEPEKKQVAFVGDSTFFASGLTGIANAVYNGHDVTVCVLDNATTAMTGSQPHPGTGVTLMGEHRKPINIEGVLRALGVECVITCDMENLAEAQEAASRAIDFEGPSAIIFRSPCVQLEKPDPALLVDAERCTGCKKCITEIGCPAVGFDSSAAGAASGNRGQAFVDASLCTGCGLCAAICPFGAIGKASGEEKGAAR